MDKKTDAANGRPETPLRSLSAGSVMTSPRPPHHPQRLASTNNILATLNRTRSRSQSVSKANPPAPSPSQTNNASTSPRASTSSTLNNKPKKQHSVIQSNLNSKSSEQYQQQEKLYLRKMQDRHAQNHLIKFIDDYYNKGIGEVPNEEEVPDSGDEEDPSTFSKKSMKRNSLILGTHKYTSDTVSGSNNNKFGQYGNLATRRTSAVSSASSVNPEDEEDESDSDTIPDDILLSNRVQQNQLDTDISSTLISKGIKNKAEFLSDFTDNGFLLDPAIQMSSINDPSATDQFAQFASKSDNPFVIERVEWQSMLHSVLTGDVVRSERTKLIVPANEGEVENFLHATYKENLWLGIKSKIYGRSEEEQKRLILYSRTLVDETIDEILKFQIKHAEGSENATFKQALAQVNEILGKWEKCEELWRTQKEMLNDKPICTTAEFEDRINALNAWRSIADAIKRESDVLKQWVGNDSLDISRSHKTVTGTQLEEAYSVTSSKDGPLFRDDRSFVERILNEKDIDIIFEKRLFLSFGPWLNKAKEAFTELRHIFDLLKLPSYIDELLVLAMFPANLIKELTNLRLVYARKLRNPTMMMIDQMIDDFKLYLQLSIEIRTSLMEYCFPQEGWVLENYLDESYDQTVLDCVHYYLFLLTRKLLDSSRTQRTFRTFKEPEELEKQWHFLQNLGYYIDNGSLEISEQFTMLTSKLVGRLLMYIQTQFQGPASFSKGELIRWYTTTTENFGALRRKFTRFSNLLMQSFQNTLVFNLLNSKMKRLLDMLHRSGHTLINTGGLLEKQGVYLLCSRALAKKQAELVKILKGSQLGVDLSKIPDHHLKVLQTYNEYYDYLRDSQVDSRGTPLDDPDPSCPPYIIALCPIKPMVWHGPIMKVDLKDLPVSDIKPGKLHLITRGEGMKNLNFICEVFLDCVEDNIGTLLERKCSLPRVNNELLKISRYFFRMSCTVLDSIPIVRNQCKGVGECQELVNNVFIYARDFGRQSLKNFENHRRSTILMKLVQLSIEWVNFIVDDCVPTEPKTFKWCVLALEFAMEMTSGFNILALNDEQFATLKLKVAGCMSLLISHFDIMGARSREIQKKRLLNWSLQKKKDLEMYEKDEDVIAALREDIMAKLTTIEQDRRTLQEEQQSVGRVLDDTDSENQFLTFLASSFSSVSIRWQKGKFIGGGTFGSVYASINLDTGGVMAVKEIRFQDSQSIRKVVPAIKDEMTVLEMLSHPNVVQYFGVEVHRDKVYIFMEYCEGGSLACLLEHGRIEDETVIQVYTLQMLEGLAYLHQSGIVHRDIKPENILLDHMGIIKFVDFGAAKVIAVTGRTNNGGDPSRKLNSMTGTPMYMSPEVITGSSVGRHGCVDIWSLGCCVLEMATGKRPWANLDNEWAIMYHIAAGHQPTMPSKEQISEQGRLFLTKCLEHNPNKRMSAVELLSDPWIVSIRNEAFGMESGSGSDVNSEA